MSSTPAPTPPREESQPQAQQHIPKFSELLPHISPFLGQEVMVPVGSGGCAVPCYKSMLGLPATYKVEHSPTSCACSDATDPEIVARYMSALYAKLAGSGSHPEAIVRLVVWMMHFQGDNFDADLRDRAERGGGDGDGAGFPMPADIPARPLLRDDSNDDGGVIHDVEQVRNIIVPTQLLTMGEGEAGMMPALNMRDLPADPAERARFMTNISLPIDDGGVRIVSDEEDPNVGIPEGAPL